MPNFTFWGAIVLEFTNLTEEKLNDYSTDEIIAIANTIFEEANKKKQMMRFFALIFGLALKDRQKQLTQEQNFLIKHSVLQIMFIEILIIQKMSMMNY